MKTIIYLLVLFLCCSVIVTGRAFTNNESSYNGEFEFLGSENDTLVKGKTYILGTKGKHQYEGELLYTDSAYISLKTFDGVRKFPKSDIVIIEEKKIEKKLKIEKDSSKMYTFLLNDGNEITAYVLTEDSTSVTVKTASGVLMVLPKINISSAEPSTIEIVDGEYLREDPNNFRLFIAPTARPMKENTAFVTNRELFFPMFGMGIGGDGSIAGGVSIIPFVESQAFYLNAKYTPINERNFALAGGIFLMAVPESEPILPGYILGTIGNAKNSLTLGIGIPLSKGSSDNPIFMIGGELRISNSLKFMTENWILTGEDNPAFTMFGMRFFGTHLSADFALLKIWSEESNEDGWPFFPVLSFSYNFGL